MFPGAVNIQAFWKNITEKTDAIQQAPPHRLPGVYFDNTEQAVDRFYCRRGGFIDDYAEFNPLSFGILPVAVEGTEPEHLLTLALAKQALTDAGVWERNMPLDQTGIIIGKGNYPGPGATRAIEIIRTGEQLVQMLKSALPHLQPEELNRVKKEFQLKKGRFGADTAMGLIPNLVASLVANRLNLGGTAYTVDAACASSLIAIDHAVNELHSGRLNMVIAGGVHVSQNAPFWSIFTQLGALSRTQQIRPFDKRADGLLIGEGCGFIVLKRLEDALEADDRIYAVIKGVGVASDGASASVMSPSVKGQSRAIRQAWEKAGVAIDNISYLEAHGTGTPLGDKTELETLIEVFGKQGSLPAVGIGSVKSMIGHAMPAAGIAGVIKTALALYHGQLPPTLHCEEPLPLMQDTRFRPVQQVADWSTPGKLRYAGVNAFGFGGINAHLVLEEAPSAAAGKRVVQQAKPEKDAVLLLARTTVQELLHALQNGETAVGEGRYRLALFNPTQERIEQAVKIVSRNKPWRNKQDIWYSDAGLLTEGGKVAFLFPGLDGLAGGEYASVSRYFQLSDIGADTTPEEGVLSASLQLLDKSRVIDGALKKLGVRPHLVAGHSLGEWLAAKSAGLAEEATLAELLAELDPQLFELPDTRFLVVGCEYSRVAALTKEIKDIYLSIENCPQQVILCGTQQATDALVEVLKKEQVFHQVMPFQSGFHSPFIKDKLEGFRAGMERMLFKQPEVPVWSATSLEEYPSDPEAIRALGVRQLTEPVYFRQLTEKLYDEGVRVFIQAGSGGLSGFVEDTLRMRKSAYSMVAANTATRSGLQQLQRVLAALFAEGADIDRDFMGVAAPDKVPDGAVMKLQLGSPFVEDFAVLGNSAALQRSGIMLAAREQTGGEHPLLAALQDNLQLMAEVQADMYNIWQKPVLGRVKQREDFEEKLAVSLTTHPYLIDHALLRQKPGWHCVADMDPVIPMTMAIELFADAALQRQGTGVVKAVQNIRVLQWMNVANGFAATLKGHWQGDWHLQMEIEKYAQADVVLAEQYEQGVGLITLPTGTELPERIPAVKDVYEKHMFHGPAYQGIQKIVWLGDKGITGVITGRKGKGSLLDNAGQLFGLWLQVILEKDRVAFPVKIQEIQFLQEIQQADTAYECTCFLTDLNDEFATCDMVLSRNGETCVVIRGWQNRRLEIDNRLWNVSIAPLHHLLAAELAPGVFWFNHAYSRVVSWDFILKRYFNQEEKAQYQQMSVTRKKEWLISRVAAKDAARALIRSSRQEHLYPIELEVTADAQGRPGITGPFTEQMHISLAHKKTEAVAIARNTPAGIDIEEMADRGTGFYDMVFTDTERALLAGKDLVEWATRCWVAKEAYGKMLGRGLMGNPKAYVIQEITDNRLRIADTWITTIQHQNYIIGWTA
jgi:acyl transferase domain-containing protein/phosphopantetheinyl transferase